MEDASGRTLWECSLPLYSQGITTARNILAQFLSYANLVMVTYLWLQCLAMFFTWVCLETVQEFQLVKKAAAQLLTDASYSPVLHGLRDSALVGNCVSGAIQSASDYL